MQVPGYGRGTGKHSIDQFKLLWTTFAGEFGTDPISISGMLQNLREQKPSRCIDPTILPEVYFASGDKNRTQLMAVERSDLADLGVEIRSICISITDEPYTNGRISRHFPWIKELDTDSSLRHALTN